MTHDLIRRLSLLQSLLIGVWLIIAIVISVASARYAASAIQLSILRLSAASEDISIAAATLHQQKKPAADIAQAVLAVAAAHELAGAVFDRSGKRIAGDPAIPYTPPVAGPGASGRFGAFGSLGPPGLVNLQVERGVSTIRGPGGKQTAAVRPFGMPQMPPGPPPQGAGGPAAMPGAGAPFGAGGLGPGATEEPGLGPGPRAFWINAEPSGTAFLAGHAGAFGVIAIPEGTIIVRSAHSPVARIGIAYLVIMLIVFALAALSIWLLNRGLIGPQLRAVETVESALHDLARGDPARLRVMEAGNAHSPIVASFNAAADRMASAVSRQSAAEANMRRFIAEAGHELRTPLAIIMGFVEVLRGGAIGDSAMAERILRSVDAEGVRLRGLIDKLLYLAKLDALPNDPHAVVDVSAIAHEVVESLRPLAGDPPIASEIEAQQLVNASAAEIRTVLSNLVDNAIKYAPGVARSVAVRGVNGWVEIEVRDAGPGVDPALQARAFDLFTRGEERGDVVGSGLGLAIVKRIVERLGGEVGLESELGRGTRVAIRLPRVDGQRHPGAGA